MKKPNVITKCVANSYASANERIVEISGAAGSGALISVRATEDEGLLISVYRAERTSVISEEVGALYGLNRSLAEALRSLIDDSLAEFNSNDDPVLVLQVTRDQFDKARAALAKVQP